MVKALTCVSFYVEGKNKRSILVPAICGLVVPLYPLSLKPDKRIPNLKRSEINCPASLFLHERRSFVKARETSEDMNQYPY